MRSELPAAAPLAPSDSPNTRNPITAWVTRNTQYGMLGLLPTWALKLYGIDGLDDRRIRRGRRWMWFFMKLAAKNRTMEQLIADATVHPYRRVRARANG